MGILTDVPLNVIGLISEYMFNQSFFPFYWVKVRNMAIDSNVLNKAFLKVIHAITKSLKSVCAKNCVSSFYKTFWSGYASQNGWPWIYICDLDLLATDLSLTRDTPSHQVVRNLKILPCKRKLWSAHKNAHAHIVKHALTYKSSWPQAGWTKPYICNIYFGMRKVK